MFSLQRLFLLQIMGVIALCLLFKILLHEINFQFFLDNGHYFFVGVLGAIAANCTGAGGGVVFIPVFEILDLTQKQSLATSLAIQCIGMTAGATVWVRFTLKRMAENNMNYSVFPSILSKAATSSIMGVILVRILNWEAPGSIPLLFGLFSLILGVLLFYQLLHGYKRSNFRNTFNSLDSALILITSFAGGIVTTWISVGVGEMIAVLLILRRFDIFLSVAIAVCVSSITVIITLLTHTPIWQEIRSEIFIFAAPGALIGGSVARYLVIKISPFVFKSCFAAYILFVGVLELARAAILL